MEIPVAADPTRLPLVRRALRLEAATVAWMAIEAGASICSGVFAGSLSLVAFGADSVIEFASAVVLLWRLKAELQHGAQFPEIVERRASKVAGALLLTLAGYVVISAGYGLWRHKGQEFSTAGLIVSALAIPAMYLLAGAKTIVAEHIGSHALRADAAQSITCAYLAGVVLVGLIAQLLFGAWWIDSIASLAILVFLLKEGREAWIGQDTEDDLTRHR